MQQSSGENQVSKITLVKYFFKENWLKILAIFFFIILIWVSAIFIFRKSDNPSKALQKINTKIQDLKKETQEINIERRVIKEIRRVQLEDTTKDSKEHIEELAQINKIEDFKTRIEKKVKLYAKIN